MITDTEWECPICGAIGLNEVYENEITCEFQTEFKTMLANDAIAYMLLFHRVSAFKIRCIGLDESLWIEL